MASVGSAHAQHLIHAHGIHAIKASHPHAQRLKRRGNIPELHGNKVWASCYVLMDYLKQNPIPKKSSVLDVGCGWGVLSSFLAKEFDASVHGADADKNVRSFFDLTADINDVDITFKHRRFEQFTGKHLRDYAVLVGSDICFWDELTNTLFKLISRALKNGVKQVLIADPGRSPFWDLADRCKKKLSQNEHINVSVFSHSTKTPKKTVKEILLIENR